MNVTRSYGPNEKSPEAMFPMIVQCFKSQRHEMQKVLITVACPLKMIRSE